MSSAAEVSRPDLGRPAWLRIDVDALESNLAAVRRAVPPGVRVHPVVKADAYGHGAVPVARFLEAAGAEGCCVATFDEALELRGAGIRMPILVLFPIPAELAPEAARRLIEVVAGDVDLLGRTLEAVAVAAARRAAPARRRLAIHLEIETGLGRGGVLPTEAVAAAARILAADGVVLAGVWSHLAAADDVAVSARQAGRFAEAGAMLADARVHLPPRHLAASGAVLAGSVPVHDAVRVGLAIYGLVPDALPAPPADPSEVGAGTGLRPVLSLHARPVRVADLPAGAGIGYGPSFVTERPSRIATLPVGYGDGWARAYSNRTDALVRGGRVPLVGTVSMDAVMADVTDVPGRPVDVDDEFVLLGEQGSERIGARELAAARGSITYEVVTAMGRRLARVYARGGHVVATRSLADR